MVRETQELAEIRVGRDEVLCHFQAAEKMGQVSSPINEPDLFSSSLISSSPSDGPATLSRVAHSFGNPSFSRRDFRSLSSFDFFFVISSRALAQVFLASSVRPSLA